MKTTIGFRTVAIFALTLCIATGAMAQKGRKHFSHEEFQAKQKEYITEKAGLTQEEANAFFPIFFELQKKKFDLQQNAHKDINRKSGEKMSEEQCAAFINKMADVKIEIAKLEKEYTAKYLKAIPPQKLLKVQRALITFQRDLMHKMTQRRDRGEKRD
jgi:hypothetical protein